MDTANKDEALKCLSLSQKHRNAQNFAAAKKWALKSISLYSTPEGQKLLAIIEADIEEEAEQQRRQQAGPSTASSTANGSANASARKMHTDESETGTHRRRAAHSQANGDASTSKPAAPREYTPEQASVVNRILKCKVTEYYEILAVQKDCDESDVKKSYRKLALQLHPDKNGAPGADEAFKLVSKAFQVLSDSNLRAAFDRHGGDPESRGGGGPTFRNARAGPGGGMQFEGELSPEDLFNMFFGGGGGFGNTGFAQFGGGPVFTTSFGGNPGFAGRARRQQQDRRRTAQTEPASPKSTLMQMLPLILFILVTFGGSIWNAFFGEEVIPDPKYGFQQTTELSYKRTTGKDGTAPTRLLSSSALDVKGGVDYFVNPQKWYTHPIFKSPSSSDTSDTPNLALLTAFEKRVESTYLQMRYDQCLREMGKKQRIIDSLTGWSGIGADWEKIRKIQDEKIDSCVEVATKWGVRVPTTV